MRRLSPALLLAAAACASAPLGPPPKPIELGHGVLSVEAESAEDAAELAVVARAAEQALPALEQFGKPQAPVRVLLLPSHAALERATHRYGYRWLRAWSRFDVVLLQSPRTWGLFLGSEGQIARLLTHELTHCAMFQAAGTARSWTHEEIPLWFREGMASVVAGEEGRRWSARELGETLRESPRLDPLSAGEAMQREDPAFVYSVAHWAYVLFERRFGEQGVRALLALLREGRDWADAFESVSGESERAFERSFVQELTALR